MQKPEFRKVFETVESGVVTPHRLRGLPGKLSGCVYRSDLTKVELSERFGGFMGDLVVSDNPQRLDARPPARLIEGRGVYLGHFMGGHYGHFITESLSTFWVFEDQPSSGFDYFLFHPFTQGLRVPSYAAFCLERFGIDREKVLFVGDDALEVQELVVPERLFRLNHSADPRSRWTYRHIAEGCAAPETPVPDLYLSRQRFSHRDFTRVVANEIDIESEFRRRGFTVLHPETLSFEVQVGYYAQAKRLAGLSGSGLHNSLFMPSDALLIELGDPRYDGEPAPTQALCNYISGVEARFIPFKGPRFGPRGTMLFDLRFLRRELDEKVGATLPNAAVRRRPWRWAFDRIDVLWLSVRPTLGAMARGLISRLRSAWRSSR